MQYLLLIYEAEAIWESKSEEEKQVVLAGHGALHDRLSADGITFSGEPLMPTTTALSVRKRDGRVQVTDGPFAETKEALAGFYLVDVPDIEAALTYAALIPHSETGTIEVRPLDDHSDLL
ncbi:MAG: YciI family protein [Pseudomonadota bacterium]